MSTVVRSVLATLVLLGATAGGAWSEDPEGSVWLWFRPGWQYANLDAANDIISSGNRLFVQRDYATVDKFHSLFNLGAELNVNLSEKVTAYGGAATLFGARKKSFNRVIETKVDGNLFNAGVMYRVPWIRKWEDALADLDLYAGGGAAFADITFTASDENLRTLQEFLEERIFTGSALGFELRLGLQYYLSPSFTLVGGATYRGLTVKDMEHEVKVDNPNAYNATGDDDRDGLANQYDPDYNPGGGNAGNVRVMYGFCEIDPLTQECDYNMPDDRFLESLYRFDPYSYPEAPPAFQVYDPGAKFDLGLGGFQLQIGLAYYVF